MIALSTNDKQQLKRIGITEQQIEQQINIFKKGFAYSNLTGKRYYSIYR